MSKVYDSAGIVGVMPHERARDLRIEAAEATVVLPSSQFVKWYEKYCDQKKQELLLRVRKAQDTAMKDPVVILTGQVPRIQLVVRYTSAEFPQFVVNMAKTELRSSGWDIGDSPTHDSALIMSCSLVPRSKGGLEVEE